MMFNGLALLTAPGRVMTPRSPSVQLVAAARARLGERRARVADVGTGSGAIAIAIAIACPTVEVWATDISHGAVASHAPTCVVIDSKTESRSAMATCWLQ